VPGTTGEIEAGNNPAGTATTNLFGSGSGKALVESGRGEVGAGAGASAVGDVSPGVVVVGASDGFERVAALAGALVGELAGLSLEGAHRGPLRALVAAMGRVRAGADAAEARVVQALEQLDDGGVDAVEVLRRNAGSSHREARRRRRRAEALAQMPRVAGALAAGDISTEHADALARAAGATSAEAVDGDAELLAQVAAVPADRAGRDIEAWTQRHQDPFDLHEQHLRHRRRRRLNFGDGEDGMLMAHAAFDRVLGAQFRSLINGIADRIWRAEGGRDNPDSRSAEQRRLDALAIAVGLEPAPSTAVAAGRSAEPGNTPAPQGTAPAERSAEPGNTPAPQGTAPAGRPTASGNTPAPPAPSIGAGPAASPRAADPVSPVVAGPRRVKVGASEAGASEAGAGPAASQRDNPPADTGDPKHGNQRPKKGIPTTGTDAIPPGDPPADISSPKQGNQDTKQGIPATGTDAIPPDDPPAGTGISMRTSARDDCSGSGDGPLTSEPWGDGDSRAAWEPGRAPVPQPVAVTPRHQIVIVASADVISGKDPQGRCEIPGVGPIPQSELERLACDAELFGILFSGDGEPLWHGRGERTATDAQRRALLARDGACVLCADEPANCESHHVAPWGKPTNGPTDIDNLALLCSTCHRRLHNHKRVLIRRPDGTWTTAPDPRYGPPRRDGGTRNGNRTGNGDPTGNGNPTGNADRTGNGNPTGNGERTGNGNPTDNGSHPDSGGESRKRHGQTPPERPRPTQPGQRPARPG